MSENRAFLGRDHILAVDDVQIEEIEVPEWSTWVRVRGMTGKERDAFEASVVKQRGKNTEFNMKDARAKLVVLCTVDENGDRIFTQADIPALTEKSSKALDRIFTVAQRLSGISKEDLNEMTKNSDDETSGDLSLD
jgi:hypothetical protein